jgi:DNA methylase
MTGMTRTFATAEARWAGVGPYYAMFPAHFADQAIRTYTENGDTVLDLFAGRGTSLYSAAVSGRHGLGIEINPVGWVYAATKLAPAQYARAASRVEEIGRLARRFQGAARSMPTFYQHCFCPAALSYLLAARKRLDWKGSSVDRTVMAILLVDLHGKRGIALSNQMRQTKSMAPDYAVRWWREHKFKPPAVDPVEFLLKKMAWRYARGVPDLHESRVYLGDSTHRIAGLHATADRLAPRGAQLLLTSPPYLGVTNYHYDQWLRLWMLGGAPLPKSLGTKYRGKFENTAHYRELLLAAFTQARDLLARKATIYVRTDSRKATSQVTREALQHVFPKHRLARRLRPLKGQTQTRLFGNDIASQAEVDFVLHPG